MNMFFRSLSITVILFMGCSKDLENINTIPKKLSQNEDFQLACREFKNTTNELVRYQSSINIVKLIRKAIEIDKVNIHFEHIESFLGPATISSEAHLLYDISVPSKQRELLVFSSRKAYFVDRVFISCSDN